MQCLCLKIFVREIYSLCVFCVTTHTVRFILASSEPSKDTRPLCVSQLGDKVAWHDGSVLKIYDVATNTIRHSIACPPVSYVVFSPKGTILASWRGYTGELLVILS